MSSQTASLRLLTATPPRPHRAGLRHVLAALALVASCSAAATVMTPTQAPVLRPLTTADGLPLNSVSTALVTQDGYLWVGTFGGLARFDGERFTQFVASSSTIPTDVSPVPVAGPPSNRITILLEDSDANLWIGTEDAGVAVRIPGGFIQVDACSRECQVNDLAEHDGAIWAATDMGLWRIDPYTFRAISVVPGKPHLLAVAFTRTGAALVSTKGNLAQLAPDGNLRWIRPPAPPHNLSITSTMADDDGGVLVGSAQDLHYYDPVTDTWHEFGIGPILTLNRLRDGGILAVAGNGTLWRMAQGRAPERVADLPASLPYRATQDTQGNLWLSTPTDGLIQLRIPWIGILNDAQAPRRAPGRGIASDGEGGFWLAQSCSGLRHWHADGTMRDWSGRLPPEAQCVETVLRLTNGDLLLGTVSSQLLRIRPGQTRIEELVRWPSTQPLRAIFERADGSLLISTHRQTHLLRRHADESLSDHPIPALNGLLVRKIVASTKGGHWFVGDHGALRLEHDAIVERWTPAEGLSSRFARALHEAPDGTLWIGTYGGGLNRIRDGELSVYTRANGLADDSVSCILPDAQGRLWLAGNRGVTLVDPASATPEAILSQSFDEKDGLAPAEANGGNQSSCLIDDDGRFWIALVRGFALVDPRRYVPPTLTPPSVHIERVAVAGIHRNPERVLQLAPGARTIEIGYTAIDLTSPERLRFRFRLSGVNENWVDAGTNRSIVFPSLPWGDHVFQVQARREGEPWPADGDELRILHPAPWYQRPWVWLVSTLLALVLLLDTGRPRRAAVAADP